MPQLPTEEAAGQQPHQHLHEGRGTCRETEEGDTGEA